MAQTVKIILEDDLDGGPADDTVTFGLDGATYEIDLSESNTARLRDALAPFVAVARRQAKTPRRATGTRATGKNPEIGKIRAWAQANGHPVSDRGRVPQHIQDAYYAASKSPSDQ